MTAKTLDELLAAANHARRSGDRQRAREFFAAAAARFPQHADAWQMLGMLAFEERQFDASLRHVLRSVELAPTNPHFVHNLALVQRAAGQLANAEHSLRRSLALLPENSQALANLGLVLLEQRRTADAIRALQDSLKLDPANSNVHLNLGLAFSSLSQLDAALACYQAAVQADEKNAAAHANLGVMWQRLGRLEDAAISLRTAATLDPELASTWSNLGVVLTHLLRTDEAVDVLRRAVQLQPDSSTHWVNLGVAILDQSNMGEAVACFRRAIAVNPQAADAWNNLGTALKEMGHLTEAADAYRTSIELKPDAAVHSNLLFCLTYDRDLSREELVAEHRVWAAMYAWPTDQIAPHRNSPDPQRRLRIGYFSPDFRTHAVARFIEPILACHDATQVEVFAYAELPTADDTTRRLQTLVPNWRWTHPLCDDELNALIRADAIDILIDLAGHTGRNRLVALSRKPAPIQGLWMGYPSTTGIEAYDYLLTDEGLNPAAEIDLEVERLYRLPCGSACFLPDPASPPVTPLPADQNGFFTFGSPHNLAKVNDGVLAAWARILNAVPTARLLMFRAGMNGAVELDVRERFARAGGNVRQLEIRDVSTASHGYRGYMSTYGEIDLCLDTFPANGGTTTCESLWMGVPWITLCGNRFFSRQTNAVQRRLELSTLAARSLEDYVSRAIHWSQRREELAAIRADLRRRFRETTVGNAEQYTRGLEASFRDMWRSWCENRRQTAAVPPPHQPSAKTAAPRTVDR